MRNLCNLLLQMILLTQSFEVFLTITIGGYTFRPAFLLLLLFVSLTFFLIIVNCYLLKFTGSNYLFSFLLIDIIFSLNSHSLVNSITYTLRLLINTFAIYAIIFWINKGCSILEILRWNIRSCVFIALVGIVEKMLQLSGSCFENILPAFLYEGEIAFAHRVRCFSHEPSFLTNYIIWGWIVLAYQIEKQDYTLFSRRKLYLFFFLVSIVILASTSKLALLCIGIWIIFRFLIFVFYTLYSGRCRLRAIKFLTICILLAPVFILGIYYCEKEYGTVSFIIEGSGFLGSPSHSYDERSEFTQRLLNIFLEKPLRGVSLGGVGPEISYPEEYDKFGKIHQGCNSFLEILVGWGIIGGFLFFLFLYKILYRTPKICRHSQYYTLLKGTCYALIMQLFSFYWNHGILRIYLWLSIAIVIMIEYQILNNQYIPHKQDNTNSMQSFEKT